jgi:hypothetical protein
VSAVSRFVRVASAQGIAQAAAAARDGIDVVLRRPDLRRRAATLAPLAAREGARASTVLEGGDPDDPDDPLWQGALRVAAEVPDLAAVWARSPLQVLARLHVLAAAGLAPDPALGRPVDGAAARRLTALASQLRADAAVPALVVAALVHADVAESFAPAGGLVGRAAERVVLVSTGLDPQNLLVPEAGHLAAMDGYVDQRAAAVTGVLAGPARWAERCCRAYTHAAERTALLAAE